MTAPHNTYQKKIITIPNLLSLFRLCLIPLIVWLYVGKSDPYLTLLVLILSGLTDVVDGIIARRFGMVSDVGKALDPVADKLTQMAMLYCLVSRFPHMAVALCLLVIKEVCSGVVALVTIRRTGRVEGADWHGKLTTVLLYATMGLHLLWYTIPRGLSVALVTVCVVAMLVSFVLYSIRHLRALYRHDQ